MGNASSARPPPRQAPSRTPLARRHVRLEAFRCASPLRRAHTGTWTVSGQDINGSAQAVPPRTTRQAIPRRFWGPKKRSIGHTVTVVRSAMANTSGAYTVNVGFDLRPLPEGVRRADAGIWTPSLSMSSAGIGSGTLGRHHAFIQGPRFPPPFGALFFVTGRSITRRNTLSKSAISHDTIGGPIPLTHGVTTMPKAVQWRPSAQAPLSTSTRPSRTRPPSSRHPGRRS